MSSLSLAYKHTVAVLSTCRKQCQEGHLQVVTEKIACFCHKYVTMTCDFNVKILVVISLYLAITLTVPLFAEISKEESRMKVVCLLLQMMSSSHYRLAKDLFTLLHKVTVFSQQNLMNADNLGAIFAPHMLCPKKVGLVHLSGFVR